MEIFDWLFLGEYVQCGDVRLAMIRAGYNGKHARRDGAALLEKKEIRDELSKIQEGHKFAQNVDVQAVLQDLSNVLTADPRDIVTVHRNNCRHCHGIDHGYQWTEPELFKERKLATFNSRPQPVASGGVGFDEYADPHDDCPQCGGLGVERVVIRDMRDLTPAQAALIASVEQTKNGVKITMRSKDSARDAAARFLGLDKTTLNLNLNKKPEEMTDDELLQFIAAGGKV